ncbi:hypothetical protein [Bacillus paralicheniformis]|uniref:hypothetical protein n=1 Tax=Bacillus paralicheniformis TaxID=1648923 RepID=UPI00128B5BC7|nr:hypothetical protein [Bacillus paralicheniformis]MPQ23779.1 hypothetical protein [Bacillus paralicheniformis]
MKTKKYILPLKKHQLPLFAIILLFPLAITLSEFNVSLFGTGINALLFNGYFNSFNISSSLFPLLVILLVSEMVSREWLSDIRVWSIIRVGYHRYISKKIFYILMYVCLYIFIGDILSLLILGITHGFQWISDPKIIAPGLNGILGQFPTTLILMCIQMIQAVGYALCSLWVLQFAKRNWETIVYPFILIVLLPIILMNLSILPESWVPSSANDLLLFTRENGWHSLGQCIAIWMVFIVFYTSLLFFTLLIKRRKGLVR